MITVAQRGERAGRRSTKAGTGVGTEAGAEATTEAYGVDAEIEKLLRCPECGSAKVRPVAGGYGFFGFKAIGDFGSPKEVCCRACQAVWLRPPMRDLRREAERRISARYDQFHVENERLRRELAELEQARRDAREQT